MSFCAHAPLGSTTRMGFDHGPQGVADAEATILPSMRTKRRSVAFQSTEWSLTIGLEVSIGEASASSEVHRFEPLLPA